MSHKPCSYTFIAEAIKDDENYKRILSNIHFFKAKIIHETHRDRSIEFGLQFISPDDKFAFMRSHTTTPK